MRFLHHTFTLRIKYQLKCFLLNIICWKNLVTSTLKDKNNDTFLSLSLNRKPITAHALQNTLAH